MFHNQEYTDVLEKSLRKSQELNINEKSYNIYRTKFLRLVRECFKGVFVSFNSIEIIEKICDFLDKSGIGNYEKIGMLNGTMKILRLAEIDINNLVIVAKKKINEYNENNVLIKANVKETENYMSMEEIEKKRDEIKKTLTKYFTLNDIYYVLLSLYTYLPPLRSEDYCRTVLCFNKEENPEEYISYLCLKSKKLHIAQGKTFGKHGERIIDVPDELVYTLKMFKIKSNSKYVICAKNGSRVSSAYFTKLFNEATGKKISSSMMRKIYVSDEIIDKNKKAVDRIKTAKIMGHSVGTQTNSYGKFSENLHGEEKKETNDEKIKNMTIIELNYKIANMQSQLIEMINTLENLKSEIKTTIV